MSLDSTASPLLHVLVSMCACAWIVVIGAPLSHAVFGHRPHQIWAFLAPIMGLVAVLLTTNITAYAAPGAPSAWSGLLLPTGLSAVVAWRSRASYRVSRRSTLNLLLLAAASAAIFILALINRTQVWFVDWAWHFALVNRIARGAFPPVTPFGTDAGIGYHYGSNLLAASLVNVADLSAWTALYSVQALLVAVLLLGAVGLSIDLGAPRTVAWGAAAALIFFQGRFLIGIPSDLSSNEANADAIHWLVAAPQALAVALVVLVAATLEAGRSKRQAVTLAAAAGAFALAEAGALLFSGISLAIVGVLFLIKLRGLQRTTFAGAVLVAAALVAFAGGPISDSLFRRGGTAGMTRIEFDMSVTDLSPLKYASDSLIQIGIIPLAVIAIYVSVRRRSWGLGYLAACASVGLVAAALVQSPLARNDARILWLATAVAMLAAFVALGTYVGHLKSRQIGWAATTVLLAAAISVALPSAVLAAQLASRGFYVWCVPHHERGSCHLGQNRFGEEVERNWTFYVWLAEFLPTGARLLTPDPAASASVSGIASPTSGGDLQVLAAYSTAVYDDALRFLNRDDLSDLQITHLHVTEDSLAAMSAEASRLLHDPRHFRVIADRRVVMGHRHRIYEVRPEAGTPMVHPSSFRMLRQMVPTSAPVVLSHSLTRHQRGSLLYLFIDNQDLRAPSSRFLDRATRIPRYNANYSVPDRGVVFLSDTLEPTPLGLARSDAFWVGYGFRAYDLSSRWSAIWRIGPGFSAMPHALRELCESSHGQLDLRVFGNTDDEVVAGLQTIALTGLPRTVPIELSSCASPVFSLRGRVPPFGQVRAQSSVGVTERPEAAAAVGFSGVVESSAAAVDIWYRNPNRIPFAADSEFRLYRSDQGAISPRSPNPHTSIRWWMAPIVLQSEEQSASVRFDAERLEISGVPGVGGVDDLQPGSSYVLTLNVAASNPNDGIADIQLQIPLIRLFVRDDGISYEALSGIVSIESRLSEPSGREWREGIAIG